MLNPRTKTGTRITTAVTANIGANLSPEERKAAAEAARARVEQLRKDGKLPAIVGREIIIRRSGEGEGDVRMQFAPGAGMRIEAPNIEHSPNGDMMVRLGPLGGAMADMKWANKATTKDLGTRDIEGIKAEEKLRSYEILAGEVGNRNAITVSDETWHSPELQVTLTSKHRDPRAGDNVYRLTASPPHRLTASPPSSARSRPRRCSRRRLTTPSRTAAPPFAGWKKRCPDRLGRVDSHAAAAVARLPLPAGDELVLEPVVDHAFFIAQRIAIGVTVDAVEVIHVAQVF
ncbi:MAG: hypothetical protein JWR40_794, partial [Massilia sp.]|nr:hypothetical protein [Massilia sp.]